MLGVFETPSVTSNRQRQYRKEKEGLSTFLFSYGNNGDQAGSEASDGVTTILSL